MSMWNLSVNLGTRRSCTFDELSISGSSFFSVTANSTEIVLYCKYLLHNNIEYNTVFQIDRAKQS